MPSPELVLGHMSAAPAEAHDGALRAQITFKRAQLRRMAAQSPIDVRLALRMVFEIGALAHRTQDDMLAAVAALIGDELAAIEGVSEHRLRGLLASLDY